MESKKFSVFAFFMVMAMCLFSIYISVTKSTERGATGKNGLSAYELAIKEGIITSDTTEEEYLDSLTGKDGLSAYELAIKNGIITSEMTEEEYMNALYEKKGNDGDDGMSAYELAIKNGLISSDMSEIEYLQSLYGKDGSNVTLESIYRAYLDASGLTETDLTYTEFILTYYPEKIVTESSSLSAVEQTTQQALRSTVDICYSYTMDTPIIYGYYSGDYFIINQNYINAYVSVGVSAGSGVIYSYEDTDGDRINDVAYIVTNYHVVYCDNYSNDSNYYIYYDSQTGTYFSGTYDESKLKVGRTTGYFGQVMSVNYFDRSSIELAPIHTHFLNDYGIYLYGHQSKQYRISATFVGGSADNDIAVLKVVRDGSANNELIFSDSYKSVTIGKSSELNEGQSIVAVGNPLLADTTNVDSSSVNAYVESAENAYIDALCLTSTSGEISNLSEVCLFTSIIDSTKATSMRLIRVSSAINAGNSGGGLYSTDGKLVGVVNGKIESSSYDNIGYAIPIDKVINIVKEIIEQCDDEDATTTRIYTLTEESIGVKVKNGKSNAHYEDETLSWKLIYSVEVEEVSGLCETAGLKVGDIIDSIKINGVNYELSIDYNLNDYLLATNKNMDSIVLNVTRFVDNKEEKLEIVIDLSEDDFIEIA